MSALSQQVTICINEQTSKFDRQAQKHKKNKHDLQKKHHLGTVSRKITGGLKHVLWCQTHPYF